MLRLKKTVNLKKTKKLKIHKSHREDGFSNGSVYLIHLSFLTDQVTQFRTLGYIAFDFELAIDEEPIS